MLCDNVHNRQRHSRIDNVSKHKHSPQQMRNQRFSCSSSDRGTASLLLRRSTKTPRKLDNQKCSNNPSKCPPPVNQASPQVSSQAPNCPPPHNKVRTTINRRYATKHHATMMIYYDLLSWIVVLSHSGGVRVSECGQEQILHLFRTAGLQATVSVCAPRNVVSLSTTNVNFNATKDPQNTRERDTHALRARMRTRSHIGNAALSTPQV